MPQPLGSKDAASFRQLVKLYEAKQHKKAIKTADTILKKNANHGDTLAMKVSSYRNFFQFKLTAERLLPSTPRGIQLKVSLYSTKIGL